MSRMRAAADKALFFRGFLPGMVSGCLGIVSLSTIVEAAGPTVEYALGLRPSQKDVDYDRPEGDAAKNATIKTEKAGGASAFVVRGATGEILRVFADTNADRVAGPGRRWVRDEATTRTASRYFATSIPTTTPRSTSHAGSIPPGAGGVLMKTKMA